MWKDSVAGYSANGLKNTYKLRQSLLNGTYKIDPYQKFTIKEPKEREIIAIRIKDRQFPQRSLCDNILYPEVTSHFIYDNCACQLGKVLILPLNRLNVHFKNIIVNMVPHGWVS